MMIVVALFRLRNGLLGGMSAGLAMKILRRIDPSLKESRFYAFVQASTSRAGREVGGGIIREFHAADPAAQAFPERTVRFLSARHRVADPDKKYSGKKNQEADKDEPGEFDADHWGARGCMSVPH
jgi:hypothetical protein